MSAQGIAQRHQDIKPIAIKKAARKPSSQYVHRAKTAICKEITTDHQNNLPKRD